MENEKWFDESIVIFGVFIFFTVVAAICNGYFLRGGWFAGILWILPFASIPVTSLLLVCFEDVEEEGEAVPELCEQVID